MALDQTDVSRANRIITVERQVWRGVVGTPRSGSRRATKEQAIRLLDHRGDAANEPFRGGGVEAET